MERFPYILAGRSALRDDRDDVILFYNMNKIILPLLIIFLALVGFGCGKEKVQKSDDPNAGFGTNAYLPPPKPPEDQTVTNLRELREAIVAFQEVKSFRANLLIDNEQGQTTGRIDVMKPDRFHGTIKVSTEDQEGEVIGIGNTLFIKVPDSDLWLEINAPEIATAMTSAFKSAVEGDAALIRSSLPDSTKVTKTKDGGRNCDKYETNIENDADLGVELSVCVSNGLPKYIRAETDQGIVDVEYFDYNTLFIIEKPNVIKL